MLADLKVPAPIASGLANRRFDTLSGGERQRVMLSAIRPGRLLMLDEPFNALDAPTTSALNLSARLAEFDAGLVFIPSAATLSEVAPANSWRSGDLAIATREPRT